jgi:hypothetical protein
MESHRALTLSERRRQSWVAMALAFCCAVYAIPLWLFWATWVNWRLRRAIRKHPEFDGPRVIVGNADADWLEYLQTNWFAKHGEQTIVLPKKPGADESDTVRLVRRIYRWSVPDYYPSPGPLVVVYPTGKSRVVALGAEWIAAKKSGDDTALHQKMEELEEALGAQG